MKTFEQIAEDMKSLGMKLPVNHLQIAIADSRKILFDAMTYFVGLEGKKMTWLPEYEKVAEWLSDNQGRGLILFGNCGRGKSILCRYAIPAILFKYMRKVASVYDVQDMNKDIDSVLSKHIISIDDIGTEELSVKFGEKRLAFAEVMDAAEKYGKLIIVSTNLTGSEFKERYGDRIIDRIHSTMLQVNFNGKSLRL